MGGPKVRQAREAVKAVQEFQEVTKRWTLMDSMYISMIEISVEGLVRGVDDPFHATLYVNDGMLKLVSEKQLHGPDPIPLQKLKFFQGLVNHISSSFAAWEKPSTGALLENTLIVFQFAMSKATLVDPHVKVMYDNLHQQLLHAVKAFRRE